MRLIPIDENQAAVVIDDGEKGMWHIRFVNASNNEIDGYDLQGMGQVVAATINPTNHAIWCISETGIICGLSRQTGKGSLVPEIPISFAPFDVKYVDGRYYVCGSSSHIWFFDVVNGTWQAVHQPDLRPLPDDRSPTETATEYAARIMPQQYDYSGNNPTLFGIFTHTTEVYFVGGKGRVMRLRDNALDEFWIESGVRLINGHSENESTVLCGSGPVSQILRGTMDDGYEIISQDDEPSLNQSAFLSGIRYIAARPSPDYTGPFLFSLKDDGEKVPVKTNCEREPEHFRYFQSFGNSIWGADFEGVYRLSGSKWRLWDRDRLIRFN